MSNSVPIEYRKVNPTFKLVFLSILLIVGICLLASFYLGLQEKLSEQGNLLFRTTLSVFQVGAGALFGLIGGKVI
jgi:hypothetical protein